MIDELVAWVGIAAALAFGWCRRDQRASCSPNEYVEGVRHDGSTWCAKSPSLAEHDCTPDPVCSWSEPVYTRPLQIYCTGGAHPIVLNARTIGCQR